MHLYTNPTALTVMTDGCLGMAKLVRWELAHSVLVAVEETTMQPALSKSKPPVPPHKCIDSVSVCSQYAS